MFGITVKNNKDKIEAGLNVEDRLEKNKVRNLTPEEIQFKIALRNSKFAKILDLFSKEELVEWFDLWHEDQFVANRVLMSKVA